MDTIIRASSYFLYLINSLLFPLIFFIDVASANEQQVPVDNLMKRYFSQMQLDSTFTTFLKGTPLQKSKILLDHWVKNAFDWGKLSLSWIEKTPMYPVLPKPRNFDQFLKSPIAMVWKEPFISEKLRDKILNYLWTNVFPKYDILPFSIDLVLEKSNIFQDDKKNVYYEATLKYKMVQAPFTIDLNRRKKIRNFFYVCDCYRYGFNAMLQGYIKILLKGKIKETYNADLNTKKKDVVFNSVEWGWLFPLSIEREKQTIYGTSPIQNKQAEKLTDCELKEWNGLRSKAKNVFDRNYYYRYFSKYHYVYYDVCADCRNSIYRYTCKYSPIWSITLNVLNLPYW